MQTSSLVLRTKVAKEVLFDPELKRFQDFDFCIALDNHGYRLTYIDDAVVVMTNTDDGQRISNSINLAPVYHWRNKIKPLVSARAYATFSINRLVRYLLLNQEKGSAARLLFNVNNVRHCRKKPYAQMLLLWLTPTAFYGAIKGVIARLRSLKRRE
ncbi:hypothetical protein C9928_06605 [Pseudidiomarina aestuarii]|uniref:Glycosyltransferase 2-like domain-containing protein n=1 Tax=Pseudidiomarina aestuarii TaxID=624146 RepID=A0A6N4DHM7_9GAMM|nr:hypothetical protein C9928_06605 [Pseudidiomarina aestuarii]